MLQSVLILMRITIDLPEQGSPVSIDVDPPCCPYYEKPCPLQSDNDPIAPGITAEMLAFHRQHPENN
jgi:hypothetical protein